MKIIKTDNYARESVADVLVCENVNPVYMDEILSSLLAAYRGTDSWFVLKPDDYTLSRGMEDLV